MPMLEFNFTNTSNLSPDDVADALQELADEFRSRDKIPEDEAGTISTPDGRDVGFWETV